MTRLSCDQKTPPTDRVALSKTGSGECRRVVWARGWGAGGRRGGMGLPCESRPVIFLVEVARGAAPQLKFPHPGGVKLKVGEDDSRDGGFLRTQTEHRAQGVVWANSQRVWVGGGRREEGRGRRRR